MKTPIACSLIASELAVQRRRWRELAARTPVERVEIATGLRLVFAAGPGVAEALEQLVAVERRCCAFADWTLTPGERETILEITAEDDAIPVLHGMFASSWS